VSLSPPSADCSQPSHNLILQRQGIGIQDAFALDCELLHRAEGCLVLNGSSALDSEALMELGVAHYLKLKVYVMKSFDPKLEKSMGMTVIEGDISLILDQSDRG
jgi:hypothetical protein